MEKPQSGSRFSLNDETLSKWYFTAYFWLLFAVQTLLLTTGFELDSRKGRINALFAYAAFMPLYGYIDNRKFASQRLWQIFACLFMLWEMSGYAYWYDNPLKIDILLFIMSAPLYWGVVLYALITMEADEAKRNSWNAKIKRVKERFRSVLVIGNALAMLFLILCLAVMTPLKNFLGSPH